MLWITRLYLLNNLIHSLLLIYASIRGTFIPLDYWIFMHFSLRIKMLPTAYKLFLFLSIFVFILFFRRVHYLFCCLEAILMWLLIALFWMLLVLATYDICIYMLLWTIEETVWIDLYLNLRKSTNNNKTWVGPT